MPGVIMAFALHNRPSLMIYGGSIKPGYSETLKKPINISTAYEKFGAYVYKTLESAEKGKYTPDEIMEDIERNACPGAGACGGMYTANTMSTSIEGMYVWREDERKVELMNMQLWASPFLTLPPRPQRAPLRCANAQKLLLPSASAWSRTLHRANS